MFKYIKKSFVIFSIKLFWTLFSYSDKLNLLSKFLYENQDKLDIYIFNKCTFLEGTKIGLFPSSTKNKNFLSQNNNFIELVKITNNQIIDDNMFIEADKLYKSLEYLNNPDILHIYGLLHFKRNNYDFKFFWYIFRGLS